MEFDILEKKKVIDGKIDFLSNYLKINYEKVIIQDWVMIDDTTTMSLDLICVAAYGNGDYVDYVMKFNRLSNALEIGVGQVIALPDIDSLIANSEFVNLQDAASIKLSTSKNQTLQSKLIADPTIKPTPSSNFIKLKGNYVF